MVLNLLYLSEIFHDEKNSVLMVLFFALLGCTEKEFTSSYLMQHPKELKTEIDKCQLSNQENNYCRMVMKQQIK